VNNGTDGRGGGGGGVGSQAHFQYGGNGGNGVVIIKIPYYQDRNIYWWRNRDKLDRWRL
jgi:hypothetical protein